MTNTLKYWLLAARPKTLPASLIPVFIACIFTIKEDRFLWLPAVICFLFALLAQIISNYFNDYFDFKKGADREDRLGPERAVASGWIRSERMLGISIVLSCLAGLLGLSLIYFAGWEIIGVGLSVALGAFAYSAGPYPLAYRGWGDVCVILFYGIIPVIFTYYVQTLEINFPVVLSGLATGIVTDNILVSNNYRDREQDKLSGKNTTIVIFGENFGRMLYFLNGIIAVSLCFFFSITPYHLAALFPIFYLIPHIKAWKEMSTIKSGKKLNIILGKSARNVIIFGLLLSLGILLS